MGIQQEVSSPVVRIRRTFKAPQALVFKAWTDPVMMSHWFARGSGTPPGVVIHTDPRPGGVYVVDVLDKDGVKYRMQGTYREVDAPNRLSFTWWYDRATYGPSLVTVELRALDSGTTELTLTHAGLPESSQKDTNAGWTDCFDMLDKAL
jgi:uncharacterized protein YndB with AHSA1/START domain